MTTTKKKAPAKKASKAAKAAKAEEVVKTEQVAPSLLPQKSARPDGDVDERTLAEKEAATSDITFADLGLSERMLASLARAGYARPTPIQQQAVPLALKGRDLMGLAQTGTGKTAAFTIPIIERLMGMICSLRQTRTRLSRPLARN